MSLEWIAAGTLVCFFGLIALLPPFDGNWDPSAKPKPPQPDRLKVLGQKYSGHSARGGHHANESQRPVE